MSRLLVLMLALVVSACASSVPDRAPSSPRLPDVQVSRTGDTTPAPAAVEEEPLPDLPLEIHYVRNSAEYRAIFEQTYRLATAALERRVADREPGTWAVAIDADETLIANSEQSKERALGGGSLYFEQHWDEWVNRRSAPALPGAKRFLERVYELGGKVAVVTNRRNKHCPQTVENLNALGFPFDVVLCRGGERDKQPRWTSVEEGSASEALPALEIVMWIGDNIHDFPEGDQELRFAGPEAFGDFGDVYFILPNPLYGSWEDNPQN